MRTKSQILTEANKGQPAPGAWDTTASLNERLTIEVLIDIRDILQTRLISIDNTILKCLFPKGGDQ